MLRDLRGAFPQLLMNTNWKCVLVMDHFWKLLALPMSVNFGATLLHVGISAAIVRRWKTLRNNALWKVLTLANGDDSNYLLRIGNLSSLFLWTWIQLSPITLSFGCCQRPFVKNVIKKYTYVGVTANRWWKVRSFKSKLSLSMFDGLLGKSANPKIAISDVRVSVWTGGHYKARWGSVNVMESLMKVR